MAFIAYLLSALVAFSGVFAGAFLARATREEMPTASRYFPWAQKIIFIAIVALLLNIFPVGTPIKLVIYAILLFSLLRSRQLNSYGLLGLFFFLLGQSSQGIFIISALVFLYGFPTGSLFIIGSRKRMKRQDVMLKILRKHGLFLVVALALQVLYSAFVLKSF